MNNLHQLGKVLNTKQQHPDEFLSSPAVSVSGWAPLPVTDGSVRIAFCEQVFADGKNHPRGAVVMSKENFNKFVESLVEFQGGLKNSLGKKEVPYEGNA